MIEGNAVEPPANPYQSPQQTVSEEAAVAARAPRPISWTRGILASLVAAPLGAVIPPLVVATLAAIFMTDLPVWMPDALHPALARFLLLFVGTVSLLYRFPEIGIVGGILFAFAALFNYAPSTCVGMIRALSRVGMYALIAAPLGLLLHPAHHQHLFAGVCVVLASTGGITLTRNQIAQDRARAITAEPTQIETAGT